MSKRYFLTDGTNTSASGLRQLAETGRLSPNDLVLVEGMSKWVPAWRLKGLFPEPVLVAELIEEAEPLPEALPVLQPVEAASESARTALGRIGGWLSSKVQELQAATPVLAPVTATPVAALPPPPPMARADAATAPKVGAVKPVIPVVQAEQPKGMLDRVCGWVANKVQEHTGVEVSPETVKVVGGVALAAVAVKVATDAVAGGSSSGSGMGRHETRATEQMMAMENTINAGGTVTWKYF